MALAMVRSDSIPDNESMKTIQVLCSLSLIIAGSNPFAAEVEPTPSKAILKLRQNARISLGALYTVEQSLHAENDTFNEDFVKSGWSPYDSPVSPFQVGFLNLTGETSLPTKLMSPKLKNLKLSTYSRYCKSDCRIHKEHFEALLVMPLDNQGHVDVWSINERKELELVKDGLTAND